MKANHHLGSLIHNSLKAHIGKVKTTALYSLPEQSSSILKISAQLGAL